MQQQWRKHFRVVALAGLLALVQQASALGLGTIEVLSHLNEPLQARIALSGLQANELDNVRAGLADEASFERAGLPRTYLLTQLKFSTEARKNGQGYIRVTSADAVREPGLRFILNVTSRSATLERRYDVLLNLR